MGSPTPLPIRTATSQEIDDQSFDTKYNTRIFLPCYENGSTLLRGQGDTTGAASVNTEGQKATYSAAVTNFVPVAAPTDIFNIFGSSTKTIRVTRIQVSAITTLGTAATYDLTLVKRSAAGTLGSAVLTNLSAVPHDSNYAVATGVPSTVATANYTTLGTIVGNLRSQKLVETLSPETLTDYGFPSFVVFDFSARNETAIVLRGTSQQIGLNLNGVTLNGGDKFDIDITWTEE